MNDSRQSGRRAWRASAALTIVGGALIAWGSQWRFTSGSTIAPAQFAGHIGQTIMRPGMPVSQPRPSTWILISLFVASILLMSLAAELATARPAREPIAWGLLLLAVLIAVCLAVVGTRVGDLGIGDQLAEAGCLCAILGSGLWISSVRRLRPQRSGAFA